jgi:hypothetical protein
MLVTIATFSFPHEAHIAKATLEASGIPAFLADEHTINMQWLYSNAMGGVRLQVPQEFAAQAQEVLNEPAEIAPIPELEPGPAPAPGACPYCGSRLGEPFAAGRRPAIFTWLLLGLPLWPVREVRKCTACGKTSTP